MPGLRLRKLYAPPYARNIGAARILNHTWFGVALRGELSRLHASDPIDVIICAMPPLLAPLVCARFAQQRSIAAIVDIIDLWPDAFARFLPDTLARRALFAVIRRYAAASLRRATAVVGVSSDYVQAVSDATCHVPTRTIHLGFDTAQAASFVRRDWSLYEKKPGARWIVYVGTVSKNYDLATAIRAAKQFPDARFIIVGDGEGRKGLEELARSLGATNVVLTGELPFPDVVNILHRGDIGLLTVDNRAVIRFPYKANDYFGSGLPVITDIVGGEIERVVREHDIGAVYVEGDEENFVTVLGSLLMRADAAMAARARRYGEMECDARAMNVRMLELIRELVAALATSARQ